MKKSELIPRFFNAPQGSYFLFGPRGTGKSLWLRNAYSHSIYLDLLDPQISRVYAAKPERLNELIEARGPTQVVILDEVQKVPELLDVIHQLIEKNKKIQFVLTGSSSRKLKRKGVNLLAGRAVLRNFFPYMAAELGKSFSLERALKIGMLPLVHGSVEPEDTLNSYASLYLREEVQMEGLVRNIGNFSRFLESISFSHASVINLANVAQDCQVERKTATGYLEILEDLLLCEQIPVFTKRSKRKLSSHPKFYWFDAGVYRSLRPSGPFDKPQEIEGTALEGLVFQHLKAWISLGQTDYKIYFWRTRAGVEVDFVLYGSQGLFAFEVKNTSKINQTDLHGLQAFGEDYADSKLYLLYRGTEKIKIKNILCLPVEKFLVSLRPGNPI